MLKAGIDQDAIIQMFSQGTAKQGKALRTAVRDANVNRRRPPRRGFRRAGRRSG